VVLSAYLGGTAGTPYTHIERENGTPHHFLCASGGGWDSYGEVRYPFAIIMQSFAGCSLVASAAMTESIDKPRLKAWQLLVIIGAMLALSGVVDELPRPHTYDVSMAFILEAAIFILVASAHR
jgi:hypothetical protein